MPKTMTRADGKMHRSSATLAWLGMTVMLNQRDTTSGGLPIVLKEGELR